MDVPSYDHRAQSAQRKRELMRSRILDATRQVFARLTDDAPVIEDVVREAKIARGTFYKHFDSLDAALVAAGNEANDRMLRDIAPLHGFLKEPWQRAAVGFRLFLLRAAQDPKWAAFVIRMDAWPHESLIARTMLDTLERGKAAGQFHFDDARVATDFVMGSSVGAMQSMRSWSEDPEQYMDAAVRMLFQALGCTAELRERGVTFSRSHIKGWVADPRVESSPP